MCPDPPQYWTSRGLSMYWTLSTSHMHAITRTMHYFRQRNWLRGLVSAVIEQVYCSTCEFCPLKIQEICPLKRFIFTSKKSKCTKMHLVAGLRPDPLGSLQRSSKPSSWIKGSGGEGVGGGNGWSREGKKERGCLKCVDANATVLVP